MSRDFQILRMKLSCSLGPALVAGLAGISILNSSAAHAVPTKTVNIGGQFYEVTYTNSPIAYVGNQALFQTPANGGSMPWWGSASLSQEFASAVAASLGVINDLTGSGEAQVGPTFPYYYSGPLSAYFWYQPSLSVISDQDNNDFISDADALFYATASAVPGSPSAAPGPLPLFGAAAAFGMSRRLRKRLRDAS
jgi:hypothetical protein